MPSERESLTRAIGTFGLAAGIINITIGGGIFRLPAIVAGSLGAAILSRAFEEKWARREPGGRAVAFSPLGRQAFRKTFLTEKVTDRLILDPAGAAITA